MSSIYSKNKQFIILFKSVSKSQNRNIYFSSNGKTIAKSNKNGILKQTNLIRHKSSSTSNSSASSFITTGLKYLVSISLGTAAGLLTGYWLILNQNKFIKNENEDLRPISLVDEFQITKYIENKDSPYSEFPLTIHLYQYESCPYCSQIRTYLDYFGFSYHLTEVNTFNKEELTKFTKARALPILVLQDKLNNKRWHLANATSILSALESIRNDKHINFSSILNQYLPILRGNTVNSTSNPYKYHVTNTNLNSVEWRKWINNYAIPAFKLNSIDNLKDLFEAFDYISEKSRWRQRYNSLKYLYVYYSNAFKTYNQYSNILKQLDGNTKKPREILHDVITVWENGLGKNHFISGTDKPNLADISMFGNVRAYEGCALFRESIAKHPKFRSWYEKMKLSLLKGYQQIDKKSIAYFLGSLDDDLNEIVEPEKVVEPKPEPKIPSKPDKKQENEINKNPTEKLLPEKTIIRVMATNYIIHVIAFTYAAWMGK